MPRQKIDPIVQGVPIVNKDGTPTPQFILLWQQLFGNESITAQQIVDAVPNVRQVLAGTGLSGGGKLSSDITLAVDTTTEAERIRDVIGIALTAGSNITLTVNDPGDTITIAASGSSPWWWVPPAPADFSFISGDATNPTFTSDTDIGSVLDFNSNAVSGDIVRAAVETITTPAAAWTYQVKMAGTVFTANSAGVGVIVRNVANNRNAILCLRQNGAVQVERRSMTSWTSTPTTIITGPAYEGIDFFASMFWKIAYDGSSAVRFYHSADGKYWTLAHTETVATFLVAAADRIGFCIFTNNGGATDDLNLSVSRRVKSW